MVHERYEQFEDQIYNAEAKNYNVNIIIIQTAQMNEPTIIDLRPT